MPRFKTIALAAGPAALLGAMLYVMLRSPDGDKGGHQQGTTANPTPSWEAVDFAFPQPDASIGGWEIVNGSFSVVVLDGKQVVSLAPEPMGEGKLMSGRMLPHGGAIRARMQGERAKRTYPRFCLGLHGTVVFQLRAAPASEALEIVANEKVVASAPWKWKPDAWLWLEFRMAAQRAGVGKKGSLLEGRAWAEGESRPKEPSVQFETDAPANMIRTVVQGAPYALRPIYFDRIEVQRFEN